MKKDNLINKIKNLLDLAEDENSQHEAEAAAKKAQALIMKYNIEEAELRQGDEATIEESLFHLWKIKNKSEGVWVRNLFHSVAKFNFCKIIIAKRWTDGELKEVLYILGEKDNIELVKYLSTQLVHRFRSVRKKEWKQYEGGESYHVFRRGFFKGAVRGVYEKLEEQWHQYAETESTAIVMSKKDEQLQKYVEQNHGDLGKARSGKTSSRSGYSKGKQAGKNADLNAGLKGHNGNRLLT